MITAPVRIKCIDQQEREVKKLAVFAELDAQGKIFIKIEGHNSSMISAIKFDYDLENGLGHFHEMAEVFLAEQIEQLRGYDIG